MFNDKIVDSGSLTHACGNTHVACSAVKLKRFISLSGGVESTTLALLYGKGATAIFADGKAEHEKMYDRLNYLEERFKEIHKGDFELIRLNGEAKHKGETYDSLEDLVVAYKYMPSGQARFCTIVSKVGSIAANVNTRQVKKET